MLELAPSVTVGLWDPVVLGSEVVELVPLTSVLLLIELALSLTGESEDDSVKEGTLGVTELAPLVIEDTVVDVLSQQIELSQGVGSPHR